MAVLDLFWVALVVAGVATAAAQGRPDLVGTALAATAGEAVQVIVRLGAMLVVWSGLAQIAQESGLTDKLARLLAPALGRLFPGVPAGHAATRAIALNFSANLLGLGNAATPFGLQAMEALDTLNPEPGTATPAMCRLLALNTAGLTLVPVTVLAVRTAAGSADPAAIVVPALLASLAGLVAALGADEWLRRRHMRRSGGH